MIQIEAIFSALNTRRVSQKGDNSLHSLVNFYKAHLVGERIDSHHGSLSIVLGPQALKKCRIYPFVESIFLLVLDQKNPNRKLSNSFHVVKKRERKKNVNLDSFWEEKERKKSGHHVSLFRHSMDR